MLEITNSPDTKQWGEFVYNHPQGNIFQTPEMAEVYKRTKNYEPISLAVLDTKNDEILAILQAVVIKEGGVFRFFSSRSIIYGGPLLVKCEEDVEAFEMLMGFYDSMVRRKIIYTEIRNMWNTSQILNIFSNLGYVYRDHLNFLIDLRESKEKLWNNLSRKRRNNIRRGMKRGVIVDEITDKDQIPLFYNLIRETYKNAKLPLADISLFESVFELLVPKGNARFFVAMHENKYIGAILVLCYKKIIYDLYAGASRKYLYLCPNDILAWHVIAWGTERSYHVFDFGGAGDPNKKYGVRDFKKQFGGKLVNFGRYKKIHAPVKMNVADIGFKLYKSVFIR